MKTRAIALFILFVLVAALIGYLTLEFKLFRVSCYSTLDQMELQTDNLGCE